MTAMIEKATVNVNYGAKQIMLFTVTEGSWFLLVGGSRGSDHKPDRIPEFESQLLRLVQIT